MRLDNDRGYSDKDFPVLQTLFGALGIVFLLVLIVYLTNAGGTNRAKTGKAQQTQQTVKEESVGLEEVHITQAEKRTAKDLNFWDMYPETEEEQPKDVRKEVTYSKPEVQKQEDNPATDGKHVQVILDDGTPQWIAINNSLPQNNYVVTGFQKEGDILRYYKDNHCTSFTGVALDKYSGEVDFEALKKEGVSFVMICVGARGYDSGVITLDSGFDGYMQSAIAAGLNVGAYFSSQAVTAEEAAEEANFMVEHVAPYHVTYPMAVKMEVVSNDVARTDDLSKNDRTTVLRAFMEALAGHAYKPMLMGDKSFLITKLDLAALSGFGIWLDKQGDIPEYPYQFSMWQYTDRGSVKGIQNDARLLLSFLDYSVR